jgi:hypothetical protein
VELRVSLRLKYEIVRKVQLSQTRLEIPIVIRIRKSEITVKVNVSGFQSKGRILRKQACLKIVLIAARLPAVNIAHRKCGTTNVLFTTSL